MQQVVISNPKLVFYYLGTENKVGFDAQARQANALKDSYDISVELVDEKNVVRALEGGLISSGEKFLIKLQGKGKLCLFDSVVCFFSSCFVLPCEKKGKRKAYKLDSVLANDLKDSVSDDEALCVPVLKCHVVKQMVKDNSWTLLMEEI